MHNIKFIRKEPDTFIEKIKNRNADINLNDLLELDKKNRELIQAKEKLEQEKKIISKKKDETKFDKSKKISKEIVDIDETQKVVNFKINKVLSSLPNIALPDVPVGKDDNFNKEIKIIGEIPTFDFKPLSHFQIGKKLNFICSIIALLA